MGKKKNKKKAPPPLSDEKIIETRARNLELYQCYVNVNWQFTKIAHVIVLRKHINQNVTGGIYLVDLLCLGIKDTFFCYNEPEEKFRERFLENPDYGLDFERIDYHLAHNIIYAGHDFAKDFGIKPHTDFATSKFILEEDNDEVPLIEIGVGDEEGKPLLMVSYNGQYADALQKLKKNAGEGNYSYIIVGDGDFEDEETGDEDFDDEDFDDDEELSHKLDTYTMGEIGPYAASMISSFELLNIEKIKTRSQTDKVSLRIELLMRMFFEEDEAYIYDEGPEFEWIDKMLRYPENIEQSLITDLEAQVNLIESLLSSGIADNSLAPVMIKILESYSSNVLLITTFKGYETLYPDQALSKLTTSSLESFAPNYPIALLSHVLSSLMKNQDVHKYAHIFQEDDIYKSFPLAKTFSGIDLLMF
ncbi:hypothetical protein BH10BAC3_BH10BAC3_01850 [soil metagenome]